MSSLLISSSVGGLVSGISSGLSNRASLDAAEKSANYNAAVAENNAKAASAEGGMAVGSVTSDANQSIASGLSTMLGAGSVGGSVDTATLQGYQDLDSDVAAIKYKYDTEVANYKNEAALQKYNAASAASQKSSAIWGGVLSGISSAISPWASVAADSVSNYLQQSRRGECHRYINLKFHFLPHDRVALTYLLQTTICRRAFLRWHRTLTLLAMQS